MTTITTSNLGEQYIKSTDTLASFKIFDIQRATVVLEDGRETLRDVVHMRHQAAAIVAVNNGKVCFVKQFRAPADNYLLELPAGKIEHGEFYSSCAERELWEETGYVPSGSASYLFHMYSTPGYSDEVIHAFYCSQVRFEGGQKGDGEEFIEVVWLTFEQIMDAIDMHELIDAHSIAAVLYAHAKYGRQHLW